MQDRSGFPHCPHSFRSSGALHKCAPSGETPAKRGAWEGKLQREGELKGAGPLITAQWGQGRKQQLGVELQSKANRKVLMRKSPRGNDSMVWKEWAPAGLEATRIAPSRGREGSRPGERGGGGTPGRGRTFFLAPTQSNQPHCLLRVLPHVPLEWGLEKGV